MLRHHDVDFHFGGALHYCVKVFNFEPQQCAVSVRSIGGIADSSMVMLNLEIVKLQDELALPDQTLVRWATVITPATQ